VSGRLTYSPATASSLLCLAKFVGHCIRNESEIFCLLLTQKTQKTFLLISTSVILHPCGCHSHFWWTRVFSLTSLPLNFFFWIETHFFCWLAKTQNLFSFSSKFSKICSKEKSFSPKFFRDWFAKLEASLAKVPNSHPRVQRNKAMLRDASNKLWQLIEKFFYVEASIGVLKQRKLQLSTCFL